MATEIAWPEAPRALRASQCSCNACGEIVTAQLESRPLCLDHFLSVSVLELEARSACLRVKPVDSASAAALRAFVADCLEQAEALSTLRESGAAPDRLRLQDFLHRCSQLSQSLRRSPRVPASVPVWLRREDPRNTWEEETWTSTVSLHGAGFVCRHSVEVNGRVIVCRRDKGKRVEARVVYSRFDSEGRRHIGVELLGRDDFWDASHLAGGTP
jgi:hypothetical protein